MSEFEFVPATKEQAKARVALAGPSGSGKALRVDQPVLTPNGWVPIGELEIGDQVMGADGLPHAVTGVFPQGVRDLYEVVMSDGTIVIADADHLWLTETVYARSDGSPSKVRTTAEIASTLRLGNGRVNHYLPMPRPLEFPSAELPVDPYLLGVLLGDGCLRTGARKNGLSFSTADAELVDAVAKLVPSPCTLKREDGYDYRISVGYVGGKDTNPLTTALRTLGLLGASSHDKHVPREYLFSAPDQRLALLQGLLDSDGSGSGYTVEFSTASEQLADDLTFLVQSFGGTVTTSVRQPSYTYGGSKRTGRHSWRLYVKLPASVEPFRLERKRITYIPRTKYQPWRQIVDVRPAAPGLAVCISVDAADRLFLTAGCVPTHNTWTSLILATVLAQGSPIAVIDTERGSASKYVGPFTFNRLNLYTYDPRDLVKALASAASSGHAVVVIDSLSRFWGGTGGMLEIVDNAAKRSYGGNSFGGWKEARPIENDMIEAILGYPGHVIVTMRTKTAYEITKTDSGKTVPVKIGLQPEQRNGIEYEFDVVADMDLENNFTVSKSRCPELSGKVVNRPGPEVGETLLAWLSDGEAGRTPNDYRDTAVNPATGYDAMRALYETVKADGKLGAVVLDDTGHMVTLHDLITRKGGEIAAAAKAAGRQIAGANPAPRPAPPGPDEPPADGDASAMAAPTEEDYVRDFLSRLADATGEKLLSEMQVEVSRAMSTMKIIPPATASELLAAVTNRRNEIRKPVAA